jgi:FKBP-type peptidyl-prolyl cis-trans isomerase
MTLLAAVSTAPAAGPELKTDEDKTFYAIGLILSGNLTTFRLSPQELELVKAGLTDGVTGKDKEKKVDLQTYSPKIQELARTRTAAAATAEKEASKGFLEKAAAEKGATKTASGIIIREITPGTGATPKATDTVKVNYTGRLIDGTVFDSSEKHGGQPAVFPLNGVIKCWTEGLQLMRVGGKSQLVCPPDLAYGDRGQPGVIKPGATLVFDVELLGIETPAAQKAPEAGKPAESKPAEKK